MPRGSSLGHRWAYTRPLSPPPPWLLSTLLLLGACRPAGTVLSVDSPTTGAEVSDTGSAGTVDTSTTDSSPPEDTATEPVEEVPGSGPGDELFTDDEVHPLSLTLDDPAWNSLLAAPSTYVEATFTAGETSLLVGIRLKGWSSFQPLTGKPNLKVSFDHYVEGQRFDGLEAVDLINEAEDPARMSEAIAYRLFRAAGQPASRTGFASLALNEQDYGLYTLVEKKDDVLIGQWWPSDDKGSLYESSSNHWPCDLDDGGVPRCDCWDQDEVGSEDARADLEALCAVATDTTDSEWYGAVAEAVDWTEVSRHMAMEMTLDAYDHYAGYMGNVYLYHAPEAGSWSLIPASMNSVFGSSRGVAGSCGGSGRVPTDFKGGILARRCWADEACTADLYEAMAFDVQVLAASDVLERIDAWEALLEPYAASDPKLSYTVDDYHTQVSCIRDWLAARPAELAPLLPVGCLGEGGDLEVDGWGDLSTNGSCDREQPDIVAFAVQGLDGTRVELGVAPDGIEAGDEVLLYVAQGSPGDHADVGSYAIAQVASVEAEALVLDAAPALEIDRSMVVQRLPHYGEVLIHAGGALTAGAWNGETGGVLAMRVSGTLTIEAGGRLTVAGLGYAGGPMGGSYNVDGYQGESLEGVGIGGASSGLGYNESNGAYAGNLGGGGCNVAGGGGEHAGGATASTSWNGTATAPQAGETYGEESLAQLLFGSGGGAVVNLGGSSGPGGAGGGVLLVEAGAIVAEGAGAIDAGGAAATAWAAGSYTYGAGGGAGGSLLLRTETLTLDEGAVVANGGAGYAAVTRPGGDGGEGRIRIDCGSVNGVACSSEGLAASTDPDAWWGGAP